MSRFLRRATTTVVVSSLLLLVSASCKPKVGQKCQAGQATCSDGRNMLACSANLTFQLIPCKGPQGCTQDKTTQKVECDDSVAEEGDTCLFTHSERSSCSLDHKKALICEDSKFKLRLQCRGPKTCTVKKDWAKMQETVDCDTSIQQKGDPCPTPGAFACSTDFKTMVQCRDGAFDLYRYCRGQMGCWIKPNGEHYCDESIAELNDPCGVPNMIVCSSDAKSELTCQGGKFVHARDCKRTGCHITSNNRIDCN